MTAVGILEGITRLTRRALTARALMLLLPSWPVACGAALLFAFSMVTAHAASNPTVVTVTLDAAITPAAAEYTVRAMRKADTEKAALVVLRLDTPGGLDSSMRTIIKAILASPVPIATFVAPDGARAASAGTYMLYASHFAAMAPATNIGAATPVNVGGSEGAPKGKDNTAKDKTQPSSGEAMRSKQINDAAAYIRGLAELRERNIPRLSWPRRERESHDTGAHR